MALKKREQSFPKRQSTTDKLPVAEPTTIKKFMLIFLLHILRKILFVDTNVKLGIYACCVTIGSLFSDLLPIPKSYFSQKNNFLNVFFVKIGWGWTFSLVAVFIYFTGKTINCGKVKPVVQKHLSRLVFGTFWWYFCVNLFNYIENVTGMCTTDDASHYTKQRCLEGEGRWIGFDISGHTFLLIHCLLTISEEAKCAVGWERIANIIKEEEDKPTGRLTEHQLTRLKIEYDKNTPIIRCLMFCLALLQIIWEVMLISTILYFHNMPQKLLAATFAAVGWLLSYNVWYKLDKIPVRVGKGDFRYGKLKQQ